MIRIRGLVLAGIVGAALVACGSGRPEHDPARPAPARGDEDSAGVRHILVNWLECVECRDGELEAAVALGPRAVALLSATLLEGPSPSVRAQWSHDLRLRHAELLAAAGGSDETREIRVEDLVQRQIAIQIARYQARSAQALAAIGGPEAERALREALTRPLRPDVERVVRHHLARLGERKR